MHLPRYRFLDLHHLNPYLLWLLVLPALVTLLGIGHGMESLQMVSVHGADTLLHQLPYAERQQLRHDHWMRLGQISLTLLMLVFFFACWLYVANRNLIALFEQVERSLRHSLRLFLHMLASAFFSLRMMRKLWQHSTPDSHAHQAPAWLVPLWWTDLIAANVCKVTAAIKLSHAATVGAWVSGLHWTLGTYVLYLLLYVLTWQVARKLAWLQRIHWHQRSPLDPASPVAAKA